MSVQLLSGLKFLYMLLSHLIVCFFYSFLVKFGLRVPIKDLVKLKIYILHLKYDIRQWTQKSKKSFHLHFFITSFLSIYIFYEKTQAFHKSITLNLKVNALRLNVKSTIIFCLFFICNKKE